ncbi:MAG: squalene--hopene cyclase [Planctomycetia bacterium]|nr:squalene--hopene cyclase [Planctomycetia bacterium]
MNPQPPPPPRGLSATGGQGRTTLVGGLPWAAPPVPDGAVPGMPVVSDDLSRRDGDEPAGPASFPARLDELVRRSPPLTASLIVHVIALLALALWVVRVRKPERPVLDLSFASTEVVEAPDPGVQIVPQPEPVEEPEPEEVKTEEPPVEDPIAAPPAIAEPIEAPGAATAEATAPVVGSLLDGRNIGRREALVNAFGGSDATEAAVARALEWLAKQQDRKDGLWSLQGPYVDGGSQENRLAATAMALLAFQGAGNTPREGKHKAVVAKGWKALVARQLPDGHFDFSPPIPSHHALYSHAQATIAACELFGMTKNAFHAEPARRALAYAVAAQGRNGAWRYQPREDGDMSVTGWYMMALKSGEMAGLEVPPQAFEGITTFLDSVAVEKGARYGYRLDSPQKPPVQVTDAISAEGLLCRQYLGWRRDDARMNAGIELLLASKFIDWENDKDVYAWYYITQVAHHMGADPWRRWNDRMREVLPREQVGKGAEAGSWDPSLDKWGHIGGRLFVTCFCTYMLEVYYRHLPIYGDAAVEAASAP